MKVRGNATLENLSTARALLRRSAFNVARHTGGVDAEGAAPIGEPAVGSCKLPGCAPLPALTVEGGGGGGGT